jgi:hypothetical protein
VSRRCEIWNLNLLLGNNNSSGGFMANVTVGGYLLFGSQQQFCVQNCNIAEWANGGAWSMVFNGCQGDTMSGKKDGQVNWAGSRAPHVSLVANQNPD